jgi:hypothetical protein
MGTHWRTNAIDLIRRLVTLSTVALVDYETRRDSTRDTRYIHVRLAAEHSHERLLCSPHEPRAITPLSVQSMISEQMLDSYSTTMTITSTRQFRRSSLDNNQQPRFSIHKKHSARSLSNSMSISFVVRSILHLILIYE